MANVEKILKEVPEFGKKVKELRKIKKETQLELARAIGYKSLKQVQRIENGLIPPIEKLVAICERYGYDLLSLIGGYLIGGLKGDQHNPNSEIPDNNQDENLEQIASRLLAMAGSVKRISDSQSAVMPSKLDKAKRIRIGDIQDAKRRRDKGKKGQA